jgi:hypothetical protein
MAAGKATALGSQNSTTTSCRALCCVFHPRHPRRLAWLSMLQHMQSAKQRVDLMRCQHSMTSTRRSVATNTGARSRKGMRRWAGHGSQCLCHLCGACSDDRTQPATRSAMHTVRGTENASNVASTSDRYSHTPQNHKMYPVVPLGEEQRAAWRASLGDCACYVYTEI